jgi:hypothetical protein
MSPKSVLVSLTMLFVSLFSLLTISTPCSADATNVYTIPTTSSPKPDNCLQHYDSSQLPHHHTADNILQHVTRPPHTPFQSLRPKQNQHQSIEPIHQAPRNISIHHSATSISDLTIRKIILGSRTQPSPTGFEAQNASASRKDGDDEDMKWYQAEWVSVATWALWLWVVAAALGLLALWGRGMIDCLGGWVTRGRRGEREGVV